MLFVKEFLTYFQEIGMPSWYICVLVCAWAAFVGLAFYIAFAFAKRAGDDFDEDMEDID